MCWALVGRVAVHFMKACLQRIFMVLDGLTSLQQPHRAGEPKVRGRMQRGVPHCRGSMHRLRFHCCQHLRYLQEGGAFASPASHRTTSTNKFSAVAAIRSVPLLSFSCWKGGEHVDGHVQG